MEYNASDTKQVRVAAKRAKAADNLRREFIRGAMFTPAGRDYIYQLLERCHIFSSSFNQVALSMAFAEGERNIGLQILVDVMAFAPDQYLQMMREANDRRIAGDREPAGRTPSAGWDAAGSESGRVETEWDPDDRDSVDPFEDQRS